MILAKGCEDKLLSQYRYVGTIIPGYVSVNPAATHTFAQCTGLLAVPAYLIVLNSPLMLDQTPPCRYQDLSLKYRSNKSHPE